MGGFRGQYLVNVALSAVVAAMALIGALAVWRLRHRPRGGSGWRPAVRALAVGWSGVILTATALPAGGPRSPERGDLVLRPGMGGLRWAAEGLREFPTTLASVLLVANVALYVPLAFLATLGWGHRSRAGPLAACLGLPVLVELIQYTGVLGGGVAAIDDVLLNGLGILLGWSLGLLFVGRRRRRAAVPGLRLGR